MVLLFFSRRSITTAGRPNQWIIQAQQDSMKLAANTNPSEQTLQGLTGEGGPLQNGVLPAADASCADGELALWKALSHEGVSRTKPNKDRTPKEAEKMAPKNPKETPQLHTAQYT